MYLSMVDYRLLKGRGSFLWSCSTKLGSRMEVRLTLQKARHQESLLCTSILGAWHQQVATRHWLIYDRRRYSIGFFSKSIFTSFKSVVIYAKKKTQSKVKRQLLISFCIYVVQDAKGLSLAGFVSWMIWRSAYLTRVLSWRNRLYVAVNWATTFVFGRDNSRIG